MSCTTTWRMTALVPLCLFGLSLFTAGDARVGGIEDVQKSSGDRALQAVSTASNALYILEIYGAPLAEDERDAEALKMAEGSANADNTSILVETLPGTPAEYEMYFLAPAVDSSTTGFSVTISAKLSSGVAWDVDLYDRAAPDLGEFVNIGNMEGVSATVWTNKTFTFTTATPNNYIELGTGVLEMLLRMHTITTDQTGRIDYASITTTGISFCGTAYACTPGSILDPTATCVDGCDNTECCKPTNVVEVDLQPCILASQTVEKDIGAVADAYLFNNLFKGFWSASQHIIEAPGSSVLDLTVNENHGKCNVIFIGIIPTDTQRIQLQDYSRKFKARLVYFDVADGANTAAVVTKLGFQQNFVEPVMGAPRVQLTADAATSGALANSVVKSSLFSDRTQFDMWARPMTQFSTGDATAVITRVAEYADDKGNALGVGTAPSAALVTYTGNDGLEEMYVFFALAWFDTYSWGWAHYIAGWGTKGIFQGERRFYLGAVVDDLFLSTGVYDYNAENQEGLEVRMTADDLNSLRIAQENFNTLYRSDIVTEFAFNGIGILNQVDSQFDLVIANSSIAKLPKGEKPKPAAGIAAVLPVDWLTTAAVDTGMKEEFPTWRAKDALLDASLSVLDKFYWQSHSLSHLARDNLGVIDCKIEDYGNTVMADVIGMWGSDNYNWRSMTSPAITGFFNKNCLETAAASLMMCYPGDNTYDGVQTSVSLISQVSQFHGIYTTEETSDFVGAQIIPRFATNVYFNCVTPECLIIENEVIRRTVCDCEPLDPTEAITMCTGCPIDDIQSFGSTENLFASEEATTARYILSGRRDKYMFHQANVIKTNTPTGEKSLLEYWYEIVLAKIAQFINTDVFPIKTFKFDDLCQNFADHEALDASEALVTATVDIATGDITGMTMVTSGQPGLIPITVPSVPTKTILLGGLEDLKRSVIQYGDDTTYYVATSVEITPAVLTKPDFPNFQF